MPLHDVLARIEKEAVAHGRSATDVTLVAVSKQQPDDHIAEVLAAGQRVFGENRVQEAAARWAPLRAAYPDVRLHLIGHLQSNKAGEAVALFDVIETLDSIKLAETLAAEMKKQNRMLPCFIQVNTGDEAQKSGVAPDDVAALLTAARAAGLNVTGLMCIPPADEQPDMHFALLHKLATRHGLSQLSMGMSGDFETAIAFGATHVRVGSAVFGERPSSSEKS